MWVDEKEKMTVSKQMLNTITCIFSSSLLSLSTTPCLRVCGYDTWSFILRIRLWAFFNSHPMGLNTLDCCWKWHDPWVIFFSVIMFKFHVDSNTINLYILNMRYFIIWIIECYFGDKSNMPTSKCGSLNKWSIRVQKHSSD